MPALPQAVDWLTGLQLIVLRATTLPSQARVENKSDAIVQASRPPNRPRGPPDAQSTCRPVAPQTGCSSGTTPAAALLSQTAAGSSCRDSQNQTCGKVPADFGAPRTRKSSAER